MEETKITADLPTMSVEIRHGIDAQTGAEMMVLQMRALPDFQSALPMLGGLAQFPLLAASAGQGQGANPLDLWTQAMEFWTAPWHSLMQANPFFQALENHKK